MPYFYYVHNIPLSFAANDLAGTFLFDATSTSSFCTIDFFLFADNTSLESHLHFFTCHSITYIILIFILSTPIQSVFNHGFYFTIFKDQFSLFNQLSGSHIGAHFAPTAPTRGQLSMSEDIFGHQNWGGCYYWH